MKVVKIRFTAIYVTGMELQYKDVYILTSGFETIGNFSRFSIEKPKKFDPRIVLFLTKCNGFSSLFKFFS